MNEPADTYVLDTSAWLTLIEDEPGADTVQRILEEARTGESIVLVSFMTFMEVYYVTLQERGPEEARQRVELMVAVPALRVESNMSLGLVTAELKATHRLSVADAWIAALARDRNAILVHKDPEFEQVEDKIRVAKLPYKATKPQ